MTAQLAEKLFYKGETLSLCSTPLGPFLKNSRSPLKPVDLSTALQRGYVGHWAIEKDHLYLVDIDAKVYSTERGEYIKVGLADFFPEARGKVFAHWFTGDLRCAMGGLLKYRHAGFSSTYEQDLYIRVKRGVVLEEHTVVNGVADPKAPKQHVVAAHTISPRPF